MNEIELILMNPEGFNWTSLNIAEWTGKLHKNVLQDIDGESSQLEELGRLIFQPSEYMTNNKSYRMYKLNKRGVMQLGARYDAKVRFKLISKVQELTEKLNAIQLHKTHAETYKQCMKTIQELCPEDKKDTVEPYCSSAAVVNKVVSTVFGFDKLIKKDCMTDEMVKLRTRVQAKYEEVFKLTNGDNSLTTDVLYGVYVPQLAETRKIKKAKQLQKSKTKLLK